MKSKVFSQRFNRELAALGLPEDRIERVRAVARTFGVTSNMANEMLFGYSMPAPQVINRIAEILEVCPHWLCGITDRKKAWSGRELEESDQS